jgi:serine protease Do/protease YdgD
MVLFAAPDLAAQDPGAQPSYGDVRLEGGFLPDPHVVRLTAGGSRTPDVQGCSYGKVAEAPDVDLYYRGNDSRTLYIYVRADEDATLLVNLPDGSWICNDDGFVDRNPILVIRNAPSGLYDIWVGTYGEDLAPARLFITEIDPR